MPPSPILSVKRRSKRELTCARVCVCGERGRRKETEGDEGRKREMEGDRETEGDERRKRETEGGKGWKRSTTS